MKTSHAAALALVGWYLMWAPLHDRDHPPDSTAPFSQWETSGSFDTATECEKALSEEGLKRFMQGKGTFTRSVGQCVATNDPRLKEK